MRNDRRQFSHSPQAPRLIWPAHLRRQCDQLQQAPAGVIDAIAVSRPSSGDPGTTEWIRRLSRQLAVEYGFHDEVWCDGPAVTVRFVRHGATAATQGANR